jgi:uncharacterized protein YbjT (DUF2867 family)
LARALIVGCGCRGRLLGTQLLQAGWAVRGTSRRQEGLEAIAEAGIEPAQADPSKPASVLELVDDVTVVAWLLASAEGTSEELAAIHGPRLDRLIERLVETPVRGFVYEANGSVDPILLERANDAVQAAAEVWNIPVTSLLVDPGDYETWRDPLQIWLDSATSSVLDVAGSAT